MAATSHFAFAFVSHVFTKEWRRSKVAQANAGRSVSAYV